MTIARNAFIFFALSTTLLVSLALLGAGAELATSAMKVLLAFVVILAVLFGVGVCLLSTLADRDEED